MSKIITFSRYFPKYHPRNGEPTFFVEKIWNGLIELEIDIDDIPMLPDELCASINNATEEIKFHTIRAGNRFKAGDRFSPRVWSGKPYRSPQIIIAPDIEVVKTWEFEKINDKIILNGVYFGTFTPMLNNVYDIHTVRLASNDGLSIEDFHAWFGYGYWAGQIICWSNQINY